MTNGDIDPTRYQETTRGRPAGRVLLLLATVLLGAALRLYLTGSLPTLLRHYRVDDILFLRLAHHLSHGEWLGPYDETTLAKGPGYPLFLAAAHHLGMSRRLAEDGLLIAACVALVWALRRLGVNRFLAAVAFAACLFSPGATSEVLYRALRQNIYLSQTLLVVGSSLALVTSNRWKGRVLSGGLLGFVLAWFWCTREEGVWIVPSLGILALVLLATERSRGQSWMRCCALVVLTTVAPATTWICAMTAVRELNRAAYGVPDWGLNEPNFTAAVDGLNRVAASRWQRWQPLDRDLWSRLYEISPALRSLRKHLDGPRYRSLLAANGERIAGMRLWALRAAAAQEGHHISALSARDFYRRVAEEIHGACDRGDIPCGARRNTIVPALHRDLYPMLWAQWRAGMKGIWRGHTGWTSGAFMGADVPNRAEVPPHLAGSVAEVLGNPAHRPSISDAQLRFHLLHGVTLVYRRLVPWLHGAGAAAAVVLILFARRVSFRWLGITVALVAAVVGRTFLVAVIETYWWPVASSYALCAYPLMPVAAVVALQGAVTAVTTSGMASELRRRLPQRLRHLAQPFGAAVGVAGLAICSVPAWQAAWGPSHPGVPLLPYTGVKTLGGRFFLREGHAPAGGSPDLVLTRTTRGLHAALTVVPQLRSSPRNLDMTAAFEGTGAMATFQARMIGTASNLPREYRISGPGLHTYRLPLPTRGSRPFLLEIIGPDPCSAMTIRSLTLVSSPHVSPGSGETAEPPADQSRTD